MLYLPGFAEEIGISKVIEITKKDVQEKKLLTYFKDGIISLCNLRSMEESTCYVIDSMVDNEKLFDTIKAIFEDLGFTLTELDANE